MNKKGFTLIELLAVIIILGILMIIAIPSVTKYISDSRKNSYIDTAKEIISGARNLVNDGKLEMYDTDMTYYLDVKCIKTENGVAKSPYGEFTKAYVVVSYDGNGYTYYWTSVDDAGEGIKSIVKYDALDPEQIESDLKESDISTTIGIDGRSRTVVVSKANNCQKEGSNPATSQVNGETGTIVSVIYPTGKTKETVVTGDLVRIGTEEFYVVKHDGNDLVLLAHYNLNVGNNKKTDAPDGIQDSNVKAWIPGWSTNGTKFGNVLFSSTRYWNGKVGSEYPGIYCTKDTYSAGTTCAYVYDSNSSLYQYVNNYKAYLEGQGATIKSARLLRVEEAIELGCGDDLELDVLICNRAPSWVYETTYWLGSPFDSSNVWYISIDGYFANYGYNEDANFGLRPVIVI